MGYYTALAPDIRRDSGRLAYTIERFYCSYRHVVSMKLLITWICGFVGSRVARSLQDRIDGIEIAGVDNLLRPGSEINRQELPSRGIKVIHGDLRVRSDVDALPDSDWVLDA